MQMKFSTEMHEYVLFIYSIITTFKKKNFSLLTWNDNLKNDQNLCWS